jgi:uncharacterized membrane protein
MNALDRLSHEVQWHINRSRWAKYAVFFETIVLLWTIVFSTVFIAHLNGAVAAACVAIVFVPLYILFVRICAVPYVQL